MSPGSVTERLHFYAAAYTPEDRSGPGGGLAEDGEDIQTVELPCSEALKQVATGQIVDAKTIMLLYWAAVCGPFAGRQPRRPSTCSVAQAATLNVLPL